MRRRWVHRRHPVDKLLLHLNGAILSWVLTTNSEFCNSCQPRAGFLDLNDANANGWSDDVMGMTRAARIQGSGNWFVISGNNIDEPVVPLFQGGVRGARAVLDGGVGPADVDNTAVTWVVDGPSGDALVAAQLPSLAPRFGVAGMFVTVPPTRILDTRIGLGAIGPVVPTGPSGSASGTPDRFRPTTSPRWY